MKGKMNPNRKGFALTAVMLLLLIVSLVAGAFVISSRQTLLTVNRWRANDECLLAAQTALEKIKFTLYEDFKAYHAKTYSWTNINWVTQNAYKYSTNGSLGSILGESNIYSGAFIQATITNGMVSGTNSDERWVLITNKVSATVNGQKRTIQETVRYTLNKSDIFDYSYFINNFGWFNGVNMVINGDIRSNFNIDMNSSSLVLNGDSTASGTNILHYTPQHWEWATYSTDTKHQYFRPGFYVDGGSNAASKFLAGYDTTRAPTRSNDVLALEMPYIGILDDYKYYAQEQNGTIRTGTTVIVSNVFNGVGPSGVSNAPDMGCLVLVGTLSNPIKLNGPVVVEGDVIIGGYFTGQGTIYAGRNIHIIKDVIATNPPVWLHPDTASVFTNTTLPKNLNRDFLGLCAKGAVVFGNYKDSSFLSSISTYIEPPFTKEYPVTASDESIGYVTSTRNGTNYFNGDYSVGFGTKAGNTVATNGVLRQYYESSLSDTTFAALSPLTTIARIDAIVYNNHLTAGRFSADSMINGGIISRDEALILSGKMYMNWDSRVSREDKFKPYLPKELSPGKTILWREMSP